MATDILLNLMESRILLHHNDHSDDSALFYLEEIDIRQKKVLACYAPHSEKFKYRTLPLAIETIPNAIHNISFNIERLVFIKERENFFSFDMPEKIVDIERREVFRLALENQQFIKLVSKDKLYHGLAMRIIDISFKGLKLKANNVEKNIFKVGQIFQFDFQCDVIKKDHDCLFKIMHCIYDKSNQSVIIGICFLLPDDKFLGSIGHFLAKTEKKQCIK